MWRSIAAVILLPALSAAQNPAPQYLQGDLPRPAYWGLTEQQTIRQGTTERADLFVSLGNAVVAPDATARDVVPFKIEFDPADGITATSVSYSQHVMMRVALQNKPLRASLDPTVNSAATANSTGISRTPPAMPSHDSSYVIPSNPPIAVLDPPFAIRFKVKVSRNAMPGTHQLHGRITYQPIRADGVFAPQKMEIVVPIAVVDHNAPVRKNSGFGHTPGFNANRKGDVIWLILLAPILIPLSVLAALVGMDC